MNTEARATLLRMKDEYERRIAGIRQDLEHKNAPVEADFAEQVTQRENDDVLSSLQSEATVELAKVNAALARIERGEYGRCVKCGSPVAPARLSALPQADMCQECAGL
ncbi:MAG: TraR/DksA family transcriptional regulator [Gammaproteobacteria bacterium]